MGDLSERLRTVEAVRREDAQKRCEEFHEAIAAAAKADAEFYAQRDFDAFWLSSIKCAFEHGEMSVDNRHIKTRRTDELYGWALFQLITRLLGVRFEVVQIKRRFWRRPYVRVSWTD